MCNWQIHTENFITKVQLEVKLPSVNETVQNRSNITKLMLRENNSERLNKLRLIRDAYDLILMSL